MLFQKFGLTFADLILLCSGDFTTCEDCTSRWYMWFYSFVVYWKSQGKGGKIYVDRWSFWPRSVPARVCLLSELCAGRWMRLVDYTFKIYSTLTTRGRTALSCLWATINAVPAVGSSRAMVLNAIQVTAIYSINCKLWSMSSRSYAHHRILKQGSASRSCASSVHDYYCCDQEPLTHL